MSPNLEITVSILLGLGISFLFKLCCDSRSCMVYRAPSLYEKIIRYDNKCYTSTEIPETCDSTKRIVDES